MDRGEKKGLANEVKSFTAEHSATSPTIQGELKASRQPFISEMNVEN